MLLFYLSRAVFETKKEQAVDEVKREKELAVFKRWKKAAPCEGAAGEECVRTNANEVQNRGDLLLNYDFKDDFEDVFGDVIE